MQRSGGENDSNIIKFGQQQTALLKIKRYQIKY
jgi:hypothetical protein